MAGSFVREMPPANAASTARGAVLMLIRPALSPVVGSITVKRSSSETALCPIKGTGSVPNLSEKANRWCSARPTRSELPPPC